jgi:hypothetical protein
METHWWDSPFERRSIQHAMKVRDEDGHVLGRVAGIGETVVFMRKRFSRELWAVPLSHVLRVTGEGVFVSGKALEALEPVGDRLRTEVVTAIHPLTETAHDAS